MLTNGGMGGDAGATRGVLSDFIWFPRNCPLCSA
jgi:hypothetical protein